MIKEKNNGLDAWNDRLDENLEPEKAGNVLADSKAEEYSEEAGSGDQSDAAGPQGMKNHPTDYEDNLAQNQPREQDPDKPLTRAE